MDIEDSLSLSCSRQLDTTGEDWELNEVLLSHTAYNQFAEEDSAGAVGLHSKKYQDAALLVREGYDNEEFSTRPQGVWSTRAYAVVHNPAWYWTNFAAALALMGLAVVEEPSALPLTVDRSEHLAVEFILLIILASNFALRLVWLKPRIFFASRAAFLIIVLGVMCCEVLVILLRDQSHYRIMRVLRPVLLLDGVLMAGVRRVMWQIILCIKYILDVMLVLFFMTAVFGLLGFILFSTVDKTYFSDIRKSVVSMFITLTTANHPDVFMEAYHSSSAAPLFFMVYLLINLYYFTNVLLAVVFARFKQIEKDKYKRLFIHRRKALQGAFEELKNVNGTVKFKDFLILMFHLKPQKPEHEVMCMFKALQNERTNRSELPSDCLSAEEFSHLFEYLKMKWTRIYQSGRGVVWYIHANSRMPSVLLRCFEYLHLFVRHRLFDTMMSAIIVANLLFLLLFISHRDSECIDNHKNSEEIQHFCFTRKFMRGLFSFNSIYIVEVMIRLFLEGPLRYFRKWWNSIDFLLVNGCFVCLCLEATLFPHFPKAGYLIIIQPLVLIRLLKWKHNYFFLIKIMVVLGSRLVSVLLLLFLVFYSYSIIGMEVFSASRNNTVYPSCCKDAWYGVGLFYSNTGSSPDAPNDFWLNNFNNIFRSYVTLYEQMVVNNWFVQMEGFVSVTSSAARVYFILFWVTTTVVLNTAIVFVVDAFESGILQLSKSKKNTDENQEFSFLKKVAKVRFSQEDVDVLKRSQNVVKACDHSWKFSLSRLIRSWKSISPKQILEFEGEFRGKRTLSNDDLCLEMYSAEIQVWLQQMSDDGRDVHKELSFRRRDLSGSWWKNFGSYAWRKTKALVIYLL